MQHHGLKLRDEIEKPGILPFIGVYDTFSAGIAGQHFDNIFISGFSFAASYWGAGFSTGYMHAAGLCSP
jgi:2-methylisocitrate lyase-like PEP mutase family enzyme